MWSSQEFAHKFFTILPKLKCMSPQLQFAIRKRPKGDQGRTRQHARLEPKFNLVTTHVNVVQHGEK
jgi:hypothetical protein